MSGFGLGLVIYCEKPGNLHRRISPAADTNKLQDGTVSVVWGSLYAKLGTNHQRPYALHKAW